jgi:transposase
MKKVTIIGVDLAKNVFQLHGAATDGSVVFRKKLSRLQFRKFMAARPACIVAMEACGSAHYWAEIDDISRFRTPEKLAPIPGLCPRPIRVVAKPGTARSSGRATSGCAGLSWKRWHLPSPAIRNFAPNTST